MKSRVFTILAAAMAFSPAMARATILTFDQDVPSDFEAVNQAYGDRITATTMPGNFLYGVGAEGFTPNVVLDYGPPIAEACLWTTRYGDLVNILFKNRDNHPFMDITFTADAGFDVLLYGWDMAAFDPAFSSDPIINSLQVFDDVANTTLLDLTNVSISETTRTTFDFSANPFRSQVLRIRMNSGNLGEATDDIGFDNIRFGQAAAAAPVPEPASMALFGTAALGLCCWTRARRRTGPAHPSR